MMNFLKKISKIPYLLHQSAINHIAIIPKINAIVGSMADPDGYGHLNLLHEYAHIPTHYRGLFSYSSQKRILIDCGANIGKIVDIGLFCNMIVYAFEPNPQAIDLLVKKYRDNSSVHILPYAVSNVDTSMTFTFDQKNPYDEGATISQLQTQQLHHDGVCSVKVVRLVDQIQNILEKEGQDIYLLKIDVESAEFDIIPDLIESGIYEKISYIVCETHELFFGKKEGQLKLKALKQLIENHNITNIHLDWI